MSYCRWSSDDYACDVYVYEDVRGGWTTHVAEQRHDFDRSVLPPWPEPGDVSAWVARHGALKDAMKGAPLVPIGLPHDGETYNDATPGECADRLESLRAVGYHVPQRAIDALREEHAEAHTPAGGPEGGRDA